MRRQIAIDMVHGPLLGKILLFSLPLMMSNILQLLFNAVDIVVVGRFSGYGSLAAVGSTSSIIYLCTNLLIGISVGVNVMVARYLGVGQNEKEISQIVHTSAFVALAGGTALGIIGILAADWILNLISTPADIYDLTLLYLRIYFVGTPFVMLYNYGAAALRAMGDTRRPLLYLTISGVVNLVLNLFFVVILCIDVAGVAVATVLSQVLSAGLIIRCLAGAQDAFRFSWRQMRMDWRTFRGLAYVGIPAGIQACLFSLSNVTIQGAINSYGSIVMAGSSAAASIEAFVYTSMNSFHQAAQTFISQNIGAGHYDRISRVFRLCMACTVILGLLETCVLVLASPHLISIYNSDPAVIVQGTLRLHVAGTMYVIYGMADVLIGAIRGYGIPIVPVIINFLGACAFRIVWIQLLDTAKYAVEYVYLSYPVSWVIILVALGIFWLLLRRKERCTCSQAQE